MLLVRTELRQSPIHGIGCYTLDAIEVGQPVWVLDSRIDLIIPAGDIMNFPAAVQEFLFVHGYREMQGDFEVIILCGDNAKYMNHASSPNLVEGNSDNSQVNIASVNIKAGEELTCNYFDFDLDASKKLGFSAVFPTS